MEPESEARSSPQSEAYSSSNQHPPPSRLMAQPGCTAQLAACGGGRRGGGQGLSHVFKEPVTTSGPSWSCVLPLPPSSETSVSQKVVSCPVRTPVSGRAAQAGIWYSAVPLPKEHPLERKAVCV